MSKLIVNHDNSGILTLTLNRPEVHNAFDDELLEALTKTLNKYKTENNVRILLIKGTGKSFCAGADLNWMRSMKDYSLAENIEDSKKLSNFFNELNEFPCPTIAQVHGAVFGGGLGILGAVDFVVAEEKSKFCFSEVKLGLIPAVISPFVLPKLGEGKTRELFLSAKLFKAPEAKELGLVSEVAKDNKELELKTKDLIKQILTLAPGALRAAKHLILNIQHQPAQSLVDFTCEAIAKQRMSKEGQEGMSALLEKRAPKF